MRSATFNLPTSLDETLRREAEAKLMSKSTLIRQILAAHVERNGAKSTPKRRKEVTPK